MRSLALQRYSAALLLTALCACPPYAAPQGNASQPAPVNATGKPQKPSKPAPKTSAAESVQGLKIGEDVAITHMRGMHIGQKEGEVIFAGPDVHLESVNKAKGTHIDVIANHAIGVRRPNHHDTADLTGNVRYTITEKTPDGTRIVQGTAQRAYYTEANKGLQLLGGVNATLTDPLHFDGPATLRVATLNMPEEGHIELTGDPSTTDARFTPHIPTPAEAAKPKKPAENATAANLKTKRKAIPAVGTVHVTGFRTGHVNQNQDAAFEGPLVTVETNNAQTKAQNTFKAPRITAGLEKLKRSINAQGGIQFDSRAVDAQHNPQRLEGTAATASWNEENATLEVDGNIIATLTNPVALLEPATLTAGHLTATLSDTPRYVVTGTPERTRFAFAPRPAAKKGKGKREKGKEAVAANPQTVPVTPNTPNNSATPAPATAPDKPTAQGTITQGTGNREQGTEGKREESPELEPPDLDQSGPTPNTQHPTPTSLFAFGNIVVSGFQTATYEPGSTITVAGPKVHFTSTNGKTKDFAEMFAPNLSAEFDDDNNIVSTKASGGVTYKFEQPIKGRKETRWMEGDGRNVVFTNTEDSRMVQVEGISRLDYYNIIAFPDVLHSRYLNKDGQITYNLANGDFDDKSPSTQVNVNFSLYAPPPKPALPANAKKSNGKRKEGIRH